MRPTLILIFCVPLVLSPQTLEAQGTGKSDKVAELATPHIIPEREIQADAFKLEPRKVPLTTVSQELLREREIDALKVKAQDEERAARAHWSGIDTAGCNRAGTEVIVGVGAVTGFSAAVEGKSYKWVSWKVSGPACVKGQCGEISADGKYTAPVTLPDDPKITVIATENVAPFEVLSLDFTIVTKEEYEFFKPGCPFRHQAEKTTAPEERVVVYTR
jgi:hypothetical protein